MILDSLVLLPQFRYLVYLCSHLLYLSLPLLESNCYSLELHPELHRNLLDSCILTVLPSSPWSPPVPNRGHCQYLRGVTNSFAKSSLQCGTPSGTPPLLPEFRLPSSGTPLLLRPELRTYPPHSCNSYPSPQYKSSPNP